MIGARHPHVAAETLHGAGDPEIVGRDDDLRDRMGGRHAAIDVLDHRAAIDERQRLAGESGGGESGRDQGDDVERRDRIGPMIGRVISRSGVHDES
jgi:hypothetical protein